MKLFPNPIRKPCGAPRAIVVAHKGRIIAEKYAPGFHPFMPLPGWTMTKTVMNALTGIMVGRGQLHLDQNRLLAEWRIAGDERSKITLQQMLHETSGLAFSEGYRSLSSDTGRMLFGPDAASDYATALSLVYEPGSTWQLSGANSVLLAKILREAHGGSLRHYLGFPHRALFEPLGMRSAVIEADASGILIGSSFMYASARDWARFGLFLLQDGIWNGERILPEGWLESSLVPVPVASESGYGAHMWRDLPADKRSPRAIVHPLPGDAFHMLGSEGQSVSIIPSHDLVVVRLGLTRKPGAWDAEHFLSTVVAAFDQLGQAPEIEDKPVYDKPQNEKAPMLTSSLPSGRRTFTIRGGFGLPGGRFLGNAGQSEIIQNGVERRDHDNDQQGGSHQPER